jgi:branched-chain amino acid transport system ATP-binding protein
MNPAPAGRPTNPNGRGSREAPFLDAKDLHAYYGASHVLHGVSLRVERGETIGLLGRNGMGKTTMLASIMGVVPPRHGVVRIGGRDLTGAPPHRIAHEGLALVPEGRGIFPNLSVRENLVMAARASRDGRRDWPLERVIDTFPPLGERLGHMGFQLSGGEQQMLTIGRALMTNPDLLMLDEATEGLAPLIRKEIWQVIRQIKATGIAAVIVDKDIRALSAIADRLIILAKGRVVFEGAPAELARQPEIKHRYLGV